MRKRLHFIGLIQMFAVAGIFLTGCHKHDHAHNHGGACCGGHEHKNGKHEAVSAQTETHGHSESAVHSCTDTHTHGSEHHQHGNQTCATSCDAAAHSTCGNAAGHTCETVHHHGSEFKVPMESQRLLGLTFVKASARNLLDLKSIPGRFEWTPDARCIYAATVAGRVELHVRPPQRVSKGQLLFTLLSPEYLARKGEVVAAESDVELTSVEVEVLQQRIAKLREAEVRNADLEQQLKLKEVELLRAQRNLANIQTTLQALLHGCSAGTDGIEYRSQQDGVVESMAVENGAWSEPGSTILVVVNTQAIWFRGDALSEDALLIESGKKGFVEPVGRKRGQRSLPGLIERGIATEIPSRVHPVYLLPDTVPEWVLPGMAGTLHIVMSESSGHGVAVPDSCVITDGLKSVIFTRDTHDQERFVRQEVDMGVTQGEWVEVHGISPNIEVVKEGAYELNLIASGSQQKVMGHFHADGEFHEGEH